MEKELTLYLQNHVLLVNAAQPVDVEKPSVHFVLVLVQLVQPGMVHPAAEPKIV